MIINYLFLLLLIFLPGTERARIGAVEAEPLVRGLAPIGAGRGHGRRLVGLLGHQSVDAKADFVYKQVKGRLLVYRLEQGVLDKI